MARILLLEERPETCYFMSMILTSEGHSVDPFTDAAEASSALKLGKYDIVLLDLDSATFDGLKFYKDSCSDVAGTRPCFMSKHRESDLNEFRLQFPNLSECCLADRPLTAAQLTILLKSAFETI